MTCHNSVLATVLVFTKILSYIPFALPQMSKYPKTVEVRRLAPKVLHPPLGVLACLAGAELLVPTSVHIEQSERLEIVISSLEEALKGSLERNLLPV